MIRRTAPFMLLLSLALAVPAATAAAEPSPAAEAPATVSLTGPFGTVDGTDPQDPATAAPGSRPLDTWMRGHALEFATDPPLAAGDVIEFAALRDGGEAAPLPLTDSRWIAAPDVAGVHTVIATVTREGLAPTQHAWLLEVPDRPGDWETLMQRPPIEGQLVASAGTVTGLRGHGCLTGMCQEAGPRPPAASLEALTVEVGEPLTLELDDGSAIVHWEGRLEPLPGTQAETRLAQANFEEPVAGPALTGLEPDQAGEWLLELRADYDRERGWQWYLFRVVAE